MRTRKVIRIGAAAFVIENIVVVVVVLFLLIQTGYLTPSPGRTVRHIVAQDETVLDIARCYGASVEAIMDANPQIDARDLTLFPPMVVTVPHAGSTGRVYGPPCGSILYTVVAGDSWQSIADKYNADIAVLRASNTGPLPLSVGMKVKVPLNSAGGAPVSAAPPSTGPTRLTIPAGTNVVTVTGTVTTPGSIRYVIATTQGQTLQIKVTIATNDVSTAVYGPNQATLKALDPTLSWSGTVAATGDQFIDIVSNLGNATKTFTLEVTLSTPAVSSPVQRVTDISAGAGDSSPAGCDNDPLQSVASFAPSALLSRTQIRQWSRRTVPSGRQAQLVICSLPS